MSEKTEEYIDEKGNIYRIICKECGKYRYYVGWTLPDDSIICHCPSGYREIKQEF